MLKRHSMKIDSLLKRGNLHPNNCEDSIFYTTVSDDWIIGAVMDGCSSGKESYFASTLFSKLLNKACKTLPLLSDIQPVLSLSKLTPDNLGKYILNQVFNDIKKIHNEFLVDEIELLSTLLLAVINVKKNKAWVNISGDGFLETDNKIIEIDQNNKPDYLSFHLNLPFDKWIKHHTKSFSYRNFSKLTLSTDGINKFVNNKGVFQQNTDPTNILLSVNINPILSFKDAINILENKHNLTPYDDIGILRFY